MLRWNIFTSNLDMAVSGFIAPQQLTWSESQ